MERFSRGWAWFFGNEESVVGGDLIVFSFTTVVQHDRSGRDSEVCRFLVVLTLDALDVVVPVELLLQNSVQ